MKQYMIIIEREGSAWGAYAPDLPGLGVTGNSRNEVEQRAREAIEAHVALLKELGETVPEPSAEAAYIAVGDAR